MKKVYLVVFDWTTSEADDLEIEVFNSYEKAVNRYNEIIENEKNCEDFWAYDAFHDNDDIDKNYEFSELKPNLEKETECYWNLSYRYDYLNDFISVKIKEIQ